MLFIYYVICLYYLNMVYHVLHCTKKCDFVNLLFLIFYKSFINLGVSKRCLMKCLNDSLLWLLIFKFTCKFTKTEYYSFKLQFPSLKSWLITYSHPKLKLVELIYSLNRYNNNIISTIYKLSPQSFYITFFVI